MGASCPMGTGAPPKNPTEDIMTTPVNHLDHLSILNLDFDIWSGKVKLTASDIKLGAGGEIPPESLAHLGQKKVIDSDKLRPFHRLKTSARRLCLGYGMPFLNGFAVPTDKVDELISQLDKIAVQMETEKRDFINGYDVSVTEWVDGNPDYAQTIRDNSLPKVVVEQRIDFDYQIFKINPVNDEQAQKLSTMASGLGNELLEEIVSEANEFFHKNINARTSCQASTKKTLLRLRNKVDGLSFLDSKFLSVVLLLDDTLKGYDAVTKKLEGGLFYQLMAAILVLSSKNKIQEYAEGSIDVSAMANSFFQSKPGVNASSASVNTETEDPETTQVEDGSVAEVEPQVVAQQEIKETVDVIPSDFEIPDDDDLDSYFKGCDKTESKPVFF